ncbi:hypothetical protein ACFVZR_07710 [Streptomyces sp. NPDC058316]|uniref:hypothetical protein n=1 Tax=unclassified Streptomyces TaxID=2593676 RepID=UPI0036EC8A19
MSKLQIVTKAANGRLAPVSPDNPLPMVIADGGAAAFAASTEQGVAVEDAPSGATNAQMRATVNELLASLRGAGLIADGAPGDETE